MDDKSTKQYERRAGKVDNSINQQEQRAVRDAQNLIAYAAKSGDVLEDDVLKILIASAEKFGTEEWTSEFALEFWKALAKASKSIDPATVESVRAVSIEPKKRGVWANLMRFIGRSPASRMTNVFTIFTLFVLLILLIFQVYWVVGSSLDSRLSNLLDREVELTRTIATLNEDYDEIELLFKNNEVETAGMIVDHSFQFYFTPEWERETLYILNQIKSIENEMVSIQSQLDRNSYLLLSWASFYKSFLEEGIVPNEELKSQVESLENQVKSIDDTIRSDPDGIIEIRGMENQLSELRTELDNLTNDPNEETALRVQLQNDIAEMTRRLANPDLSQQIINQREIKFNDLNSQVTSLKGQIQLESTKELSFRARLAAGFVLDILQSYILPLLYGLLGASTYVLRSMSTEIKDMQYSVDSNRGYILRLALGTLAGLIVGWFIFLLPGQTFLASISPFAVAFLVGYNIEIIFSFMDNLISRISEAEEKSEETSKPDEGKPKESLEIAPDESTLSKLVEAININTATQTELESISGIGPVTAEAIIHHRQENGPFGKVEDIQKVSRIGADTFEKIKANITVG